LQAGDFRNAQPAAAGQANDNKVAAGIGGALGESLDIGENCCQFAAGKNAGGVKA